MELSRGEGESLHGKNFTRVNLTWDGDFPRRGKADFPTLFEKRPEIKYIKQVFQLKVRSNIKT